MKIRLTGLPAEVEHAAARLAGVVTVRETSRRYPRRAPSALVSLYLDAALDAPAEGAPLGNPVRKGTPMDPITLDPHPAAGHSGDYTLAVASAVSDAVRVLNYATLAQNAPDGVPYPSTVYDVAGSLQAAAAEMGQLFGQLADRLADIATTQQITVSHGPHTGHPDAATDHALDALVMCAHAARELDHALRNAHGALSPLGIHLPTDPTGDARDGDDRTGAAR